MQAKKTKNPRKTSKYIPSFTKANWTRAGKESLSNIGFTVVGGGLLATLIGRPSALLGAGVTLYGSLIKNKQISSVGAGMMAVGLVQKPIPANEIFSKDKAIERVRNLKDHAIANLYLDKVVPGAKPAEELSGIFLQQTNPDEPLDFSALEQLQAELAENAEKVQMHLPGTSDINGTEVGALPDAEILNIDPDDDPDF